MGTVRALLFAVLSLRALAVIIADRKFGCMFEDEVCEAYEVCINDGVFGRCQRYSDIFSYTDDVTPQSLQRLRNILQKLAHRGYTWQDDKTEEVISKELSHLPKVPLGRYFTGNSRTDIPSDDRKAQTEELRRTLQRYLQELGFQTTYSESYKQSPQEQQLPWKYRDNALPNRKSFIQLKEKLPPAHPISFPQAQPDLQAIAEQPPSGRSSFTGFKQDHTGVPLAELQQYQAGSLRAQDLSKGQTQGKLRYFSLQRAPATKIEKLPGAFRQPPKPRIEKMFFKSGASSTSSKNALSSVDEKFIDRVVNQLGRQSVNVEALKTKDLDQLSKVITQALHVVDGEEGVKGREVTQDERPEDEMELKREPGDQSHPVEKNAPKETQTEESDSNVKNKGFLSQLLEFLDQNYDPDSAGPKEPFLGNIDQPNAGSPVRASLENVQSRTTQTELDPMKNKMETDTLDLHPLVDPEVEQWIHSSEGSSEIKPEVQQGKPTQKSSSDKEETVQKKGVRVEVNVATYSHPHDGDFGYIITEDSLSTNQGLNLMELLAQLVNLRVTDFLQLSVLGPAVTFRVRPNARNISTALLARVAVEQKGQLEKESGLQILGGWTE